jgi:2-methylcitrate dehydratase PrpD
MVTSEQHPAVAPDFAEEFARSASAWTIDTLPHEVVEAVKTDLFDTLACAMAGISAPGVAELAGTVVEWGGKPEAAIWCTAQRVPAHHAAWVNGMMAHARDFDDSHDTATLHAGVSVIPAAIAAAEAFPSSTGADILAGIAAGLELASRLGLATTVSVVQSGYLYTSLYGHFAATAAAARVMRFDAEQTINALGIAFSQAAGTHQVTRDSALTKRMQPGFAAKTALISTALARAGIQGARRTFEGEDGLFKSNLHGNYTPSRLREGLGERFDLMGLSYKLYPCCRFAHAAIDAALELRARVPVQRIRKLTAYVNRMTRDVVGLPIEVRRAPTTTVHAQFSIPYTVACALVNGSVALRDFTDHAIQREEIRGVAARVSVEVDLEIDRQWSRTMSPARLVAETDDGPIEVRVEAPRGSVDRPMAPEDFDRKMASCIETSGVAWPSTHVQRVRDAIKALATAPDGRALLRCLDLNTRQS